jgi:alpha-beta hydrolase superfamily lysophospholipase
LRRLSIVIVLMAVLGSSGLLAEGARAGVATTTQVQRAVTWADEPVSFQAAGMKIYATLRHPVGETAPVPAVLLIAGSGPTDRNGNSAVEPGPTDTLRTLADWLSEDGVASLRYDKLGSGQSGLGPYADKVDSIGITVYEKEAAAALIFLGRQRDVDDQRLAVFGHSEGALFALLLATGHAGKVPRIHALGLLEPLGLRYLDLITVQVDAQLRAQVSAGEITKKLESTLETTLASAVKRLRATGKGAANLPYGLGTILNPSTAKYLYEADKFDPETLGAEVAAKTPVILSCSNADTQVSCPQVNRVAQGLSDADASATVVHLVGVDHVLKVDPTGSASNYTRALPFSPVLKKAIEKFVAASL